MTVIDMTPETERTIYRHSSGGSPFVGRRMSVSSHSVTTQSAWAKPAATIPRGSSRSSRVPHTAQRASVPGRISARTIHRRTLTTSRQRLESWQSLCRFAIMSSQNSNPAPAERMSPYARHCSSAYISRRFVGRIREIAEASARKAAVLKNLGDEDPGKWWRRQSRLPTGVSSWRQIDLSRDGGARPVC
jgi:hypothetical protein